MNKTRLLQLLFFTILTLLLASGVSAETCCLPPVVYDGSQDFAINTPDRNPQIAGQEQCDLIEGGYYIYAADCFDPSQWPNTQTGDVDTPGINPSLTDVGCCCDAATGAVKRIPANLDDAHTSKILALVCKAQPQGYTPAPLGNADSCVAVCKTLAGGNSKVSYYRVSGKVYASASSSFCGDGMCTASEPDNCDDCEGKIDSGKTTDCVCSATEDATSAPNDCTHGPIGIEGITVKSLSGTVFPKTTGADGSFDLGDVPGRSEGPNEFRAFSLVE